MRLGTGREDAIRSAPLQATDRAANWLANVRTDGTIAPFALETKPTHLLSS